MRPRRRSQGGAWCAVHARDCGSLVQAQPCFQAVHLQGKPQCPGLWDGPSVLQSCTHAPHLPGFYNKASPLCLFFVSSGWPLPVLLFTPVGATLLLSTLVSCISLAQSFSHPPDSPESPRPSRRLAEWLLLPSGPRGSGCQPPYSSRHHLPLGNLLFSVCACLLTEHSRLSLCSGPAAWPPGAFMAGVLPCLPSSWLVHPSLQAERGIFAVHLPLGPHPSSSVRTAGTLDEASVQSPHFNPSL